MTELPIEQLMRYVCYLAIFAAALSITDTLRSWIKDARTNGTKINNTNKSNGDI